MKRLVALELPDNPAASDFEFAQALCMSTAQLSSMGDSAGAMIANRLFQLVNTAIAYTHPRPREDDGRITILRGIGS